MIHTLPSEVLYAITYKLSFNDKLNLCKTCHKLYEAISRTNLYELLVVRKNTENIIRMFQDKTFDGTQVQLLDILMDDLSDELYSNLADIFPNVTSVRTHGYQKGIYAVEDKVRQDHITRPLLKWKDSIKKFNDGDDWRYFRNELFQSIFPRLQDLSIVGSVTIPGRKEGFDPLFLSRGIINAPMLTRLCLEYCDISIDSLQVIHNGCPYIRSLQVQNGVLIIDSHTLPLPMTPAYSVLSLKIDVTCLDICGLFLDYIIRKYPNLEDLDINIYNTSPYSPQYDISAYYLNHMGSRSENSEEHKRIVRDRVTQARSTLKTYKETGSAFLSQLPKSIQSLKLQSDIFNHTTKILSKRNIPLSTLRLHSFYDNHMDKASIHSDQLGDIKGLTSLRVLEMFIDRSVPSYQVDFISYTVTTLEVSILGSDVSINWILSMFPSLESLQLEYAEYMLVKDIENNIVLTGDTFPKLQRLSIFGPDSDEAYSDSSRFLNDLITLVPNVVQFRYQVQLNRYNEEGEFTRRLDFTGWHLTRLDIEIDNPGFSSGYYTILSTPKGKHRFLKKRHQVDFSLTEEEPYLKEKQIERIIVDITCEDIKEVFVDRTKLRVL